MATSGGLQSGGSGVAFPAFSGSGSPEGVQVGAIGQYYEDTDTGILYAKIADDGMDTGWLGAVQLGDSDTFAQADTDTTVTADGTPVAVACIIAAPPDWMDNAGNIIAPGLYAADALLQASVAPTVPGLGIVVTGFAAGSVTPFDSLGLLSNIRTGQTVAIGAADLPVDTTTQVTIEIDATGEIECRIQIQRLAFNAP